LPRGSPRPCPPSPSPPNPSAFPFPCLGGEGDRSRRPRGGRSTRRSRRWAEEGTGPAVRGGEAPQSPGEEGEGGVPGGGAGEGRRRATTGPPVLETFLRGRGSAPADSPLPPGLHLAAPEERP